MARSNRGSSHAQKHPYLRVECWANGQCAFYLNKQPGSLFGYNVDAYMDFHRRQIDEAGRLGKL